jgi:hypothetical protein
MSSALSGLLRCLACSFLFLCMHVAAAAPPFIASVDDRTGLPVVSRGGSPAVSGEFTFVSGKPVWFAPLERFDVTAPYAYSWLANFVGLELTGQVKRPAKAQLSWTFGLRAQGAKIPAANGGIRFTFDLEKFRSQFGDPEILPQRRGWAWGRAGGPRVQMLFDQPPVDVSFPQQDKSEILALFVRDGIVSSGQEFTATLTVSDDVEIGPTSRERFGLDDPMSWPADIVDAETSPVDLSFLNAPEAPAGKHGFLKRRGDRLVFDDGTPVRFWGTNVTAMALFDMSRENIKRQAHRLSALGFNLIRLHHHDSSWVQPNIFGDESKLSNTRVLNAASLAKIDWWIKCLKDEGIYVWLDLHVGRQVKIGDGIEDFAEIARGSGAANIDAYNYVNGSIRDAMQRFNESYLNHQNAYTGLKYKDDPAIVTLLLTNENDLTQHYGAALLPNRNVPKHAARYMAAAYAFAAAHGLRADDVWRAWQPGPAKLFLNDLERRFDVEMIDHLHQIGVKIPIVTTSSWGRDPLTSLPALTSGDMIDVHSYGWPGQLEKNPLYGDNLVDWIAAAQVVDFPVSVTEWNVVSFPAPDRHVAPLYVASSASLQGWDSLMQYAYGVHPLVNGETPSNWHAFNDPALLATLPAGALLFRRGDVAEARTVYVFTPTKDQLFGRAISPANSVALRTATELGKLLIAMPEVSELPWLQKSRVPDGAKIITDPDRPLFDEETSQAVSDTGEVRHNWADGTLTIDTPRTQAATGWIGGKQIALADVEIDAVTRNASVAVQSLTNDPIEASGRILISLGARSVPKSVTQLPFYSEPVTGHLAIRAKSGLKLYRRIRTNDEEHEVPTSYENGRYLISLDKDLMTYWLVLK